MPSFEALETKKVTVIFKESYPLVIVVPDKDSYSAGENVDLSIKVVNGGEEVENPFLESEVVGTDHNVIHLNMIPLDSMDALSTMEYTDKFELPSMIPTGMYFANVRFREDFNVINIGSADFQVRGTSKIINTLTNVIILIAVVGVIYMSVKRLRGIGKEE